MEIDELRKLIFVADTGRIKSFAWGSPGRDDYRRALPTHTMASGSWKGPIALLSGDHFIRAGKGSVHWEDVQIDEDEDADDVELSGGSKATGQIKFADTTLKPATWGAHPSVPNSMICGFTWKTPLLGYSCVVVDLEHGGKTVTRYLGHGGEVLGVSTSPMDPQAFVTGCSDGYARLFDVRQPLPVMTFNAGRGGDACSAIVLAYPDGIPSLFTGVARAQEVRLWDIRAKDTIYELSTGSTAVESLAWDVRHNALYAATECRYMDRMGSWHGYRRAKVPKDQRYTQGSGEGDMVVDKEDDGDEDGYASYDSWDDRRCWPKMAYHGEKHFGYLYDAGEHKIFRYAFKEDPDTTFLPPYGGATAEGGSYW